MSYEFKYADLLDDDVFKLVFGRESTKDVMIEFLNQVITDRNIVDLDFMDKEMHPLDTGRKSSIYDMFCKTDEGSRIIVEVQRRKQPYYAERAIYYSTFQIQRQIEAGSGDYNFLPVYVISILNFHIADNDNSDRIKTVYRFREEHTHTTLTDRVTLIFLELSKFKKGQHELSDDILEGMYFCLKNMSHLKGRPEALDHDIFRKIFDACELLKMDEITRLKVIDKMTTERDLRNQMEYARKIAIEEGHKEGIQQGIQEGIQQGIQQGKTEKAREIAQKLISAGMPIEEVSDIVGLSKDKLSSLIA